MVDDIKRRIGSFWSVSICISGIAIASLVPLLCSTYVLHLVILFMFHAYLAQSWNLVGGYLRRLSLGHALFVGTGAYLVSMLWNRWKVAPWLGLLLALAAGFLIAGLIGAIVLRYRLSGAYFALFTIAAAEIARLGVRNAGALGGAQGLIVKGVEDAAFYSLQWSGKVPYYFLGLGLLSVATIGVAWFRLSSLGLAAVAVGDGIEEAEVVGINSSSVSLLVFSASGALAAAGGVFYAQYFRYVHPDAVFGLAVSIGMVVRCMIGGRGTILGPIVGAAVLTPVTERTRSLVGLGEYGTHVVVFGLALVTIALLFPDGAVGMGKKVGRRLRAHLWEGGREGLGS